MAGGDALDRVDDGVAEAEGVIVVIVGGVGELGQQGGGDGGLAGGLGAVDDQVSARGRAGLWGVSRRNKAWNMTRVRGGSKG